MTRPIAYLPLALVAALAGAVGGAWADVYKIVGPDGRITYSDQPPRESGARASIVNRPPASGAVVLPPPATAIMPWSALSADARRGIVPAFPIGETASSPSVVTYSLADALTTVLARAEIVQTMRDVCVRNTPATGSTYDDAARRWQQRNAAVVAKAGNVLAAAFDPPRRAKLQADARTRLGPIVAPLASSSMEAKLQWCDQAVEAFNRGELDMVGARSVASPVMDFVIP